MSVKPVIIKTDHDTTTFDPESHRAPAAEQLGLDPDAIHCISTGPDDFTILQEEEVDPKTFAVLKPRVVQFHRRTTWEPRPTVVRPKAAPLAEPPKENNTQPKLPRGARWHGTVDGVEGNYVSDGKTLHHADTAEAKAVLAASGSGTGPVGK